MINLLKHEVDGQHNKNKIVELAVQIAPFAKFYIGLNWMPKDIVIESIQAKIDRKLNDMFYCKTF